MQESRANLDSTVERGRRADHGSGGIAEWRLERKDKLKSFAAMKQKDPNDLELQCDFLIHELQVDYPELDKQLREGKRSIENLTANFCFIFERPSRRLRPDGSSIANLDGRIRFAKENLVDAQKETVADGGIVVATATGASASFTWAQGYPIWTLALIVVAVLIGIAVLLTMRRSSAPPEWRPAAPLTIVDELREAQERVRDAIEVRDAIVERIKSQAEEIKELYAMTPAAAVSIDHMPERKVE